MTGKPASIPAIRVADPVDSLRFMFAVGIECSCPTIEGNSRVDQLRDTGHYEQWRTDLKLVRELGLRYLRYGPPIYRIWLGPNKYDWSQLDPIMSDTMKDKLANAGHAALDAAKNVGHKIAEGTEKAVDFVKDIRIVQLDISKAYEPVRVCLNNLTRFRKALLGSQQDAKSISGI